MKKKLRSRQAAPEKPVIPVAAGDYVIIKISTGKEDDEAPKFRRVALKVYSVKGGEVTGADLNALNKSEDWELDDEKLTRVPQGQVILNLGQTPEEGSVYGCKILIRHDRFDDKPYGPVISYIPELAPEALKGITLGIQRTYELYKGWGLDSIFPVRIELYPAKGKYAGFYKTVNLAKEEMDKVAFLPTQPQDVNYMQHVASHEFAHGLMNRLMSDADQVLWIKEYHKHLVEGIATKVELARLWKSVVKKGSIELSCASLDEDGEARLDACLAYIHDNHYLDLDKVDRLLAGGNDLSDFWPVDPLPVNYMESPIGEYSQKNPSEFFCEAVRLYAMKEKLPKSIHKLVESTFKNMRGKGFDRSGGE